jgi:hypothetical protein
MSHGSFYFTVRHLTAQQLSSKCSINHGISTVNLYRETLSNPIFLPTAYSPALIYLSPPFSYKHNRANRTHNHLFTSKHMACRETERVQSVLSVGQSPYYMRKSVGQAPTAERVQPKRIGRLPTSERIRKIIMSDEVRLRIGKG